MKNIYYLVIGGVVYVYLAIFWGYWLYALSPIISGILLFWVLFLLWNSYKNKNLNVESFKEIFILSILPFIAITSWLIVGYFIIFRKSPLEIFEIVGSLGI